MTEVRPARTGPGPLHLLPLLLVLALSGVAVLVASVAPSRVTTGVYEVVVGADDRQFSLFTEALSCTRAGDVGTCEATVAGQQLVVEVRISHPRNGLSPFCRAGHGERQVDCTVVSGDYGHASGTVLVADDLGVAEPELSRLRDAEPWWRAGNGLPLAALALIVGLAIAAGGAAHVLSRRTGPMSAAWRFPAAAGVGALGLLLFGASGVVIAPNAPNGNWIMMAAPPAVVAAFVLAAWQYQVTGTDHAGRIGRVGYAVAAVLATAIYSFAVMFVFLLHSGFID